MSASCMPDDTRASVAPCDSFADILDLLRVRGALAAWIHARTPWGLRLDKGPKAIFHGVTEGECWVRVEGEEPRLLRAGEIVLFPTGAAHVIAGARAGAAQSWYEVSATCPRHASGQSIVGGTGHETHLICASYEFDHTVALPLLSQLPPVLILTARDLPAGNSVQSTLGLIRHELERRVAGSSTVIDRLIDVLFVYVLRAWLSASNERETSWQVALRDPVIARALTALHASPARAWTTDRLAREVSLSRATLIRRFTALVGEPPLAYLTRWRMDLAARLLRNTGDAISVIAERVGYSSEFAFSRAFARVRGRPPGRYRAEARYVRHL